MSELERIVLVDLGTPGRWDAARIGTGLVADVADTDGGQTLRRVGAAGTTSGIASVATKGSWVAVVEVTTLTTGTVTVGVRQANARKTLAQARLVNSSRDQDYVIGSRLRGYSMSSIGTKLSQGSSFGTGTTWAQGDRFVLKYNAVTRTLSVFKNTSVFAVATWTGLVGPLEIVATPGGANSALRLVTDVDDVPWSNTYRPAGIWGRIATVGWMTPWNDTVLRNCYYDGRIDPDSEPSYSERANIPMFESSPARSVGDFLAINPDRALDAWLDWTTRDELLTIRTGLAGQPFSAYVVEAVARIDLLESAQGEEDSIRITPRDASVALEIPWQAEQYPVTTPLVAVRQTTKPTAIGVLRGVPLTMVDSANVLYDLGDDAAYSISALYDQAVPITLGSGYTVNADRKGVKRVTNPLGKQVVDMTGSVTDSTVYMDARYGDFSTWISGVPDGFVYPGFTGAGCSVTNAFPGARFQAVAGGNFASLHIVGLFAAVAMNLRIDITVSARTSGTLNIRLTDFGANFVDTQVSAAGIYTFFVAKTAAMHSLQLFSNFIASDFTITRLRITRTEAMDTLGPWMKHLATERGMLSIDQLDTAGIATIAAARAWPLCLYAGQGDQSKVIDILDRTCASMGTGWWFDSLGRLRMMMVQPALAAATYTLTNLQLIGDLSCEHLHPRGLSDRVGSVPMWAPHDDSNIAGSVLTTAPGRQRAEEFKRDYISVAKGADQLASDYDYAANADPTPTLLSTAAGGQSLADLTTSIFKTVPKLFKGEAWREPGNDPPIGSVVTVTTDQWNLDAGGDMQVIGRDGLFSGNTVQLLMVKPDA